MPACEPGPGLAWAGLCGTQGRPRLTPRVAGTGSSFGRAGGAWTWCGGGRPPHVPASARVGAVTSSQPLRSPGQGPGQPPAALPTVLRQGWPGTGHRQWRMQEGLHPLRTAGTAGRRGVAGRRQERKGHGDVRGAGAVRGLHSQIMGQLCGPCWVGPRAAPGELSLPPALWHCQAVGGACT